MFPVTVDFETEAICPRPDYPPQPVGVSIKFPGRAARYYAFGHPTANNCSVADAHRALKEAWEWRGGLLFHNMKFDIDVAETFFDMPRLDWTEYHDTMFQVFLDDPHATSHALKPSAERLLGMPPEERDAVKDWLVKQGIVTRASKQWGAFIAKAPGDLVGTYADGDVVRTEKLHKLLLPKLKKRGMGQAYNRERQLALVLLDMEWQGVDVDTLRLDLDLQGYRQDLASLSTWICKRGALESSWLDSGGKLVDGLVASGKIDTSLLGKTPTGAWKTDKDSLAQAISDPLLAAALNHRASLQTCVGTFLEPWLATAQRSDGKIYTQWNQLKQMSGNRQVGAVTGRMSCTPNLMNIPKRFPDFWAGLRVPVALKGLHPLPLVRSYIIAPPGHVLIDRDYSQQELRILAHYEDADLKQAYLDAPWMDIHQLVLDTVLRMVNTSLDRDHIKPINFGLIYGMGIKLLAKVAGISDDEAKQVKAAIMQGYPGWRDLSNGLRELSQQGQAIATWGGRCYYVEPPKLAPCPWDPDTLQERTFEYKLLNVLVQGSAADCTKEAMIRYALAKPESHKMLFQIHDEILCAVPEAEMADGMRILQLCMEGVKFDVPMLSEGKTSTTNWAELKPYDKKGSIV